VERGGRRLAIASVLLALTAIGAAGAAALPRTPAVAGGSAPNRLDRNLGAVLSSPRVHHLFWDSSWSSRAAHAGFHRGSINFAIGGLQGAGGVTGSTFLNGAAQYGVGRASFTGSDGPSALCGAGRSARNISAKTVHDWVTCMVGSVITGVPLPGPRVPVSNDLYIVYLPARTTITDNLTIPAFNVLGHNFGPFTILVRRSCVDYGAYHAFSAVATGLFAYAVVPTRCFAGDDAALDEITVAATHELVEAATDPLILAGWIDNSVTMTNFARLSSGEAADICSGAGAVPTGPRHVNGVLVARYWSNSAGACF
jgi:hypothetical protein